MNKHRRQACFLVCAGTLLSTQAIGRAQAEPSEALGVPASRTAGTTYSVVNLGVGQQTDMPKINNRGQVGFSVWNQSGYHALFYDGQTVRDLGHLGANDSYVSAVNDAGQVVGGSRYRASPDFDYFHAFKWSRGTGMVDLGALPTTVYSTAKAVNNRGEVAGSSFYNGRVIERFHAVRWSANGAIADLGTLYGSSGAVAINDAGQIVGGVRVTENNDHAFFWTAGRGMLDLGSLGSGQSSPADINSSGQVIGDSPLVPNGEPHAFSWKPWQRMRDLGTLGGTRSRAVDINDGGQIVGVSTTVRGREHGFLWNGTGRLIDLGTLGGADSLTWQINRYGTVVGRAMIPGGAFHGYAWTRAGGMADLNSRLQRVPRGLVIDDALGVGDDGTIVASSNAGLVVLKPGAAGSTGPAAPLVGPMTTTRARINTPFPAVVQFLDADAADTHQASWSWGDGSKPERASLHERNGTGRVSGTHTFRAEGTYVVVLTVSDSAGQQASAVNLVRACNPASAGSCVR